MYVCVYEYIDVCVRVHVWSYINGATVIENSFDIKCDAIEKNYEI